MKNLPTRERVSLADTWDLSKLFASDEQWERGLAKFARAVPRLEPLRGRLGEAPGTLAECLALDAELDRLGERLGAYAYLKSVQDQTNSTYARMVGRFRHAMARAGEATSFVLPEILAIAPRRLRGFLRQPELADYQLLLERMLRYRPHTLGPKEEQLLAQQAEMAGAAGNAFRKLLDADLNFGRVTDERGRLVQLTHASYASLLQSPQRSVRAAAFRQYYAQFQAHEQTLAATLAGSVQADVYYARARGYDDALHRALFPDHVPRAVYDQLIAAVRQHLPDVHHYLDVRRRKMKLRQLRIYDTYVPLVPDLRRRTSWDQAVRTILAALRPLGDDYGSILAQGLNGRWCDKYPNRHKQSGAFSYGTYDGDPYIMMNYKPDLLEDLFTLAHEAGHSMHSHYSARRQPFLYYRYTIFVAEVASTFNEELLSHYLLSQARDDRERAYLINRSLDAIRATLVRQTMFAEFEQQIHESVEQGEPLTVQSLKDSYRKLLRDYLGPAFQLDDALALECLRIPHFYRAFYVYKYATGLSAAITLSQRVLAGGAPELQDYLNFLAAGCAKDPLDLLRDAGVDMCQPGPVQAAMQRFRDLVEELDQLL